VSELYYQHSGKYPAGGLLMAILGGGAAAMILAVAYAYLLLYIPLAGYVTVILIGGFGFLLGFVTAYVLKRGKVRSLPASYLAMALVGVAGLYTSWGVWIYALLRREEMEADLLTVLTDPAALWNVIAIVNKTGAWTIRNWSPTDTTLWALWGIEAVMILGVAFYILYGAMQKEPFCESCGTWCEENAGVARINQADGGEVRQHLEMKDYGYLEKLGGAKADAAHYVELDLHSCPNCRMTHTLTGNLVTVTINKKGEKEASKESVADKLLVTPSDAETLRTLGQKLATSVSAAK